MSTNTKRMTPHDKKETLEALRTLAKGLRGDGSVINFIDSLLTESEQVTIGRRVLMAKMILEGHSRAEIRYKLNMSPNTFSRTRRWLERELPNYNDALVRFDKEQTEKRSKQRKDHKEYLRPFSLADLQRRYPMYFLLLNVIDELRK